MYFKSIDIILQDFNKIWQNCRDFNYADDEIVDHCNKIEKYFNLQYNKMPAEVILNFRNGNLICHKLKKKFYIKKNFFLRMVSRIYL